MQSGDVCESEIGSHENSFVTKGVEGTPCWKLVYSVTSFLRFDLHLDHLRFDLTQAKIRCV